MAVRDATQDELIQRIHCYILWQILRDWGGLFGDKWNREIPKRPASDKEMLRILRSELRGSFIERETKLLHAMIEYLEQKDGFGRRNAPQTFLVKFDLIWEDICNDILDNQYEDLKKHIPYPVYSRENGKYPVHPPKPDILCSKKESDASYIYIFDAKYYKEASTNFYCEPCMKQFMYAYLIGKSGVKIGANVFLIPCKEDKVACVGEISLAYAGGKAFSEPLPPICVLHLPIRTMLKEYVQGMSEMQNAIYDELHKHSLSKGEE